MLVEVGAVEVRQPVRVVRKMRGDPIDDHADAPPVEPIHEFHEVPWGAVAACGREQADGLITPGAVERMLRDGKAPATALRDSKLAMIRRGGKLAHPFHWAGFVLWGLID